MLRAVRAEAGGVRDRDVDRRGDRDSHRRDGLGGLGLGGLGRLGFGRLRFGGLCLGRLCGLGFGGFGGLDSLGGLGLDGLGLGRLDGLDGLGDHFPGGRIRVRFRRGSDLLGGRIIRRNFTLGRDIRVFRCRAFGFLRSRGRPVVDRRVRLDGCIRDLFGRGSAIFRRWTAHLGLPGGFRRVR